MWRRVDPRSGRRVWERPNGNDSYRIDMFFLSVIKTSLQPQELTNVPTGEANHTDVRLGMGHALTMRVRLTLGIAVPVILSVQMRSVISLR